MSKNTYIGIVAVIIILAGAIFFLRGSKEDTETTRGPSGTAVVSGTEIVYTDTGFAPSNLAVKVGDAVTFKNQSSVGMRAASDPHPTHTNLSGFDAGKVYAPGESYTYTFTKSGTWGYHNHAKSAHVGTVTVE